MDAWIGRVKWRRPYRSRVFRGLLLYSSYAFSQIQSACQVRTILYFSANLVESSRYLLTFYLSGNVYHSWYELFSFSSKHLWALSQHSIILNFFLLCEFARTLIMPLPSCSSSASSLALLLLLRNEFSKVIREFRWKNDPFSKMDEKSYCVFHHFLHDK